MSSPYFTGGVTSSTKALLTFWLTGLFFVVVKKICGLFFFTTSSAGMKLPAGWVDFTGKSKSQIKKMSELAVGHLNVVTWFEQRNGKLVIYRGCNT